MDDLTVDDIIKLVAQTKRPRTIRLKFEHVDSSAIRVEWQIYIKEDTEEMRDAALELAKKYLGPKFELIAS